ncbi:GDNF family receptor alpha-1a isoform X1 [Tachysurus ichikawai]
MVTTEMVKAQQMRNDAVFFIDAGDTVEVFWKEVKGVSSDHNITNTSMFTRTVDTVDVERVLFAEGDTNSGHRSAPVTMSPAQNPGRNKRSNPAWEVLGK